MFVNFYGAIFADEGCVGLGIVIRNEEGLVMASLSQLIPIPLIVFEVEVLAARRGVELALELGFNSVELEGDSAVLISALKVGQRPLPQYGHIVADIQYLASYFSVFNLSDVRRHCNKVAHSLVRKAIISPLDT